MNSSEVRSYLWNFLRNKGLGNKSSAAVLGNVYAESGFDANIIESGNGIGFGICQWSFDRRKQLERYGTSLSHQLYFLWSELTGEDCDITGADFQWIDKSGYLSHSDFMKGNGTIEELTRAFCFCWERPNYDLSHIDIRVEKALEYYEEYANGEVPEEPDEPPAPEGGGEVYADIEKSSYNVNKIRDEQKELLKQLSYNDTVKIRYTFNKNKSIIGHSPTNKRLTLDNKEYIIYSVRNDGLIDIGLNDKVSSHKYIDCRFVIPYTTDTDTTEDGET